MKAICFLSFYAYNFVCVCVCAYVWNERAYELMVQAQPKRRKDNGNKYVYSNCVR